MKGTFIVVLLSLICGLAYVNASETNVTITRRDSSNTTVTVSNTVLNETQFANVKKVLQGESSEADNRERWSEIDRRLEERRSKIKVSYHEGLPKNSEHTDPANSKKKRKSDCVAATAPPGKRDITSRGDKFPDSHSHCAIDCGNGINYREVSDFIDDVIHGSHGDLMNDEIGANGGMYTISPTNLNFVLIQLNGGPDPVRLGALSFGGALIPVNGDCTTYQKFGGFQESRDQLNIWLVTTIEVLSDIRGDAMGKFKSCIDHGRSGNMRISNRAIAKKGEATDTLEKPNISSNLSSSNVTPGYIHVYAGCGLNCGNSMDYADCSVLVEDATYNAKRRIEKATGIAPRGSFVGIYGSCGVTVINNDEEREVTVPYNSFAADSLTTSNFIGSYSLGGGGEEQAPGLRCTEYLMGEPDRIAPNSAAIEGCIEHANRNVGGCL